MILSLVLLVAGFAILIFGANGLVDGSLALAKKFKVPDLAIGLTIVAFGTSAPELVVNLIAVINGHDDIVLGNIIGSNNFNIFIILGLSGMIFPISVQSSTAWKEIPLSFLVLAMLFLLANDFQLDEGSRISRLDGLVLLAAFTGFLFYVVKQMQAEESATTGVVVPLYRILFMIFIGLAGLIIGGQLVVQNSVWIAATLGLSEKIIGLTIVAAGTSLPELVTSVVAAIKKKSDIAIGNVIGSNIFNILFILSISAIVSPIDYDPKFNREIYILAAGTIFLILAMKTGVKRQLDRWEAAVLLLFYLTYLSYLVNQEI